MARDPANMSVVITGAGSGIGAATARQFVEHGALVTICGQRADRIEAVASELGPRCRAVIADVTVDADRRALVDTALEHGRGCLDVLVNNAGIMYRGPVEELAEPKLLEVFNVNVVGPMLLTGLAVEALATTAGCVVFIGSVHTQRAFPGASPYAATKGAIETLTAVLAAELGPRGVRVGCVRPGAVSTELYVRAGLSTAEEAEARLAGLAGSHALGRIGTATEVAEAIEHLAVSEWTTGSVLTVDGGLGLGVTNT